MSNNYNRFNEEEKLTLFILGGLNKTKDIENYIGFVDNVGTFFLYGLY